MDTITLKSPKEFRFSIPDADGEDREYLAYANDSVVVFFCQFLGKSDPNPFDVNVTLFDARGMSEEEICRRAITQARNDDLFANPRPATSYLAGGTEAWDGVLT